MTSDHQIRIPALAEFNRSSRSSDIHVEENDFEELAKCVMTITPCEAASILNFDRKCATKKQQPEPDGGRHHDAFLITSPGLLTVEEALQTGADESVASTDTGATILSNALNPLKRIVQTGSYLLSLDIPPINLLAGWYFGRGRPTTKHGGVDFLLADEQGIHSIQLVLNYSKSGQLCVWAPYGNITLDGRTLPKRQMVPLPRVQHFLRVGLLAYRLDYTVPLALDHIHHRLKSSYLKMHQMIETPSTLLSATPRENDVYLGKWKLYGVVDVGGSSVFEAASHTKRDRVAAIKSLLRSSTATTIKADKEIRLYKEIKNSVTHRISFGRFG